MIPWPIGIVRACTKDDWDEPADVEISFGFDRWNRAWNFHRPEITSVSFDPKRIELKDQDRLIQRESVEASAYAAELAAPQKWQKVDATSECVSQTKDGQIVFRAADKHCTGMTVTMTFKISYSDLREGTLQINGLAINDVPVSLPETKFRRGGRFKFWSCCVIND